jgi:hypothetical protein
MFFLFILIKLHLGIYPKTLVFKHSEYIALLSYNIKDIIHNMLAFIAFGGLYFIESSKVKLFLLALLLVIIPVVSLLIGV